MAGLFFRLKDFYRYKAVKKSSTYSGALVFYAILGLVPTVYLFSLTLSIFGKELSILNGFYISSEFEEIKAFLISSAKNIGTGGNIIAGLISIYSATNLFHHLKITGEAIYSKKSMSGVKMRIFSIIGGVVIFLILSLSLAIFAFFSDFISNKFGALLTSVLSSFVFLIVIYLGVILVNFFVCPYKIKLGGIIKGSTYTVIFGFIFTVVFLVYVKYFASYDKIYGKVAVIPMFLVWLFIVFRCLVDGFIINSRLVKDKQILD